MSSDSLLAQLRKLLGKEYSARQLGFIAEADMYAKRIEQRLMLNGLSVADVLRSGEVYGYPPPPTEYQLYKEQKRWYQQGYYRGTVDGLRQAPDGPRDSQIAWYRGYDTGYRKREQT